MVGLTKIFRNVCWTK